MRFRLSEGMAAAAAAAAAVKERWVGIVCGVVDVRVLVLRRRDWRSRRGVGGMVVVVVVPVCLWGLGFKCI